MAATCQQHLNRCRPVETERILTGTLDRKCQGLTEFRSEPLREGPHARVGKKDSMSNSSNVITKSDSDLAVREQGLFIGSLIPPKPVGRAPPGRIFTVDSCVIENMTLAQLTRGGSGMLLDLAISVPALAAGAAVGIMLFGRVNDAVFRRVVLTTLLVSGLTLAW